MRQNSINDRAAGCITEKFDNPRLDFTTPIRFDKITPAHYEEAINQALFLSNDNLQRIINEKGERTFENTMLALDRAMETLDTVYGVISHLGNVKNSTEHRTEYAKIEKPVSEFRSGIPLNQELWQAIKEYAATDEAKGLTGARRRFLDLTLLDFKREGADLPQEKKDELLKISASLSELTTRFRDNVIDSKKEFFILITDEAELDGIPESARSMYADCAAKAGKEGWMFNLDSSNLTTALTYLHDEKLRERIYRAFMSVASTGQFSNRDLITEIMDLRQKKAAILGFDHFADLVTSDRMAGTGKGALRLLTTLREASLSGYEREARELMEYRKSIEGEDAPALNPWDITYYSEQLKQENFSFNSEGLRPYLQSEKVFQAFFDTVEKLYGLRVEQDDSLPVWNSEVRTYAVYDGDETLLAHFYADLLPRNEEKRDGAWMDNFIVGNPRVSRPHLGLISANFRPPTDGKPSLLSFSEAETLFHELGHLMHLCLAECELQTISGTNVPWDFVELPSQIMENWCRSEEVLKTFATHYESGEPMPAELLKSLMEAQNFRNATFMQRQLALGISDLYLHMAFDQSKDGHPVEFSNRILQESIPAPIPEDYALLCSLTHLYSDPTGYAGGYYSYMWASVLEADAFSRFQQEGLLNPETGMELRTLIAGGNTIDPKVAFNLFMKREPNADPSVEPLLKREGILEGS